MLHWWRLQFCGLEEYASSMPFLKLAWLDLKPIHLSQVPNQINQLSTFSYIFYTLNLEKRLHFYVLGVCFFLSDLEIGESNDESGVPSGAADLGFSKWAQTILGKPGLSNSCLMYLLLLIP